VTGGAESAGAIPGGAGVPGAPAGGAGGDGRGASGSAGGAGTLGCGDRGRVGACAGITVVSPRLTPSPALDPVPGTSCAVDQAGLTARAMTTPRLPQKSLDPIPTSVPR